ncbi:hypothetical protein BsWGS_21817 [Bradybaena similaris]
MSIRKWTSYFILLMTAAVSAFPSGSNLDLCLTMFPKHKGTQTQLEKDVYTVDTDSSSYLPNQRITVTISSPRGRQFKGVQIRAHRIDLNPEEILGSFDTLVPAEKLKLLGCQGRPNNTVTHSNSQSVDKAVVTWIAPSVNVGPIVFEVTVVESYFVFFHGLRSAVIQPATGSPSITPPLYLTPVVSETVAAMDWSQCGETKGCLLYPTYCTGDNCKVAVSYVLNQTAGTATFEMMVRGEEYISLGFSDDVIMGDDQTISCCSVYDRVSLLHGWNHPKKSNIQLLKTNLTNLEAARSQDGSVYCRFTRPVTMNLEVSYDRVDPVTLTFDLNSDYYLFVAWGKTYTATDIMGYHTQMPVISDSKVDFSEPYVQRGSVMPKLIRAHSTMMAVAWMGFAGLAIVMARYYKDGFNDKKICGIKIWFHIHRISAVMTFVLTVAGIVVVLVKLDGKITEKESAHTHMCLGFTVVALVCAQVLGGLVRPGPNKRLRPIFNFFHRLLGQAALVIAAAALICAYKIADFSYEMQRFGERTVAVWAGAFVFLEIVLTGYKYFKSRLCVHSARSDQYNLDKDSDTEPVMSVSPSHILLAVFLLFIACSITAACLMTLLF